MANYLYLMLILTLGTTSSLDVIARPKEVIVDLLYKGYKDEILCDITLTSGAVAKKAHKFILTTIPYFERMLSGRYKEAKDIDIHHTVPESVLEPLLDYIYMGSVSQLSLDQALVLFEVANKLLLDDLVENLVNVIAGTIDTSNCIDIMEVLMNYLPEGKRNRVNDVYDHAEQVYFDNMIVLSEDPSFLNLDWHDIYYILQNDNLQEQNAFHVAMRWLLHDKAGREEYVEPMFTSVIRLADLPKPFLQHTVLDTIKTEYKHKKGLIKMIIDAIQGPVEGSSRLGQVRYQYVASGNEVYEYKYRTRSNELQVTTIHKKDIPTEFYARSGMINWKHKIYLFGGYKGVTFDTIESYDLWMKKWQTIDGKLVAPHSAMTAVTFSKGVLLVGGLGGGHDPSLTTEIFDPETETSTLGPSLNHKQYRPTVVNVRDKIYVLASWDTKEVEMADFNERNPQFRVIGRRPKPLQIRPCVVVIDDNVVYSLGGYRDKSVTRYTISTNKWEVLTKLESRQVSFKDLCKVSNSGTAIEIFDTNGDLVESYNHLDAKSLGIQPDSPFADEHIIWG